MRGSLFVIAQLEGWGGRGGGWGRKGWWCSGVVQPRDQAVDLTGNDDDDDLFVFACRLNQQLTF